MSATPKKELLYFSSALMELVAASRGDDSHKQNIITCARAFAAMVTAHAEGSASPVSPDLFASRAWRAYVNAIQAPEYYFSVDELLCICQDAGQPVAILTSSPRGLQCLGCYGHSTRHPVVVRLLESRDGSLRTHFEKLVPCKIAPRVTAQEDQRIESITVVSVKDASSKEPSTGEEKRWDGSAAKKLKL